MQGRTRVPDRQAAIRIQQDSVSGNCQEHESVPHAVWMHEPAHVHTGWQSEGVLLCLPWLISTLDAQRWGTGEEIKGFESENYLKITVFPTQNSEVRILLALFSVSLNFGAVITLKELKGVNRIEEFIKACMLRGYIVNRLDIENRIEIINSTREEIRFD